MIAAWLGHRRSPRPWKPRREADRDVINRPATVLTLACWTAVVAGMVSTLRRTTTIRPPTVRPADQLPAARPES